MVDGITSKKTSLGLDEPVSSDNQLENIVKAPAGKGNLSRWLPRVDGWTALFFLWIVITVAAIWILAHASHTLLTKIIGGLVSLLRVAAATAALPAESLTEGLFTREVSSPLWYRTSRLIIMCLPAVFWVLGSRRAWSFET